MQLNKKLFTIIIPTIWNIEFSFIYTLLNDLNDSIFVGEIILIDNSPLKLSSDNELLLKRIRKLNHVKQEKNIYVNPAWNLGVALAKYDYLCVLNDDVNTDWNILNIVYNDYFKSYLLVGMIGLHESCYKVKSVE